MRTYLIESQSIFIPFLRGILEHVGCDVIATSRVVDLVDIAENAPSTVFVDVDYLHQSGPTMLCRIRETARSATLIALSEIDDALFAATCIVSGASAVCSKTNDTEKFTKSVRGFLVKAS